MNKLVSVIISTRNTKREYLLDAVSSILNQTYKDLELLVIIDGGNYDGCLREFNDERLRVIRHKESLGLATRLNEAISASNGDYIARMDSDDYAVPDRLEKQVNYLELNSDIDICSMYAKSFGDKNSFRIYPSNTDKYIKSELFLYNVIIHPAVMMRKSSIVKHHIRYDETFSCSQDYALWSGLINVCTFGVLPEVGLFYRVHDKQVSSERSREQISCYRRVVGKNLMKLGVKDEGFKMIDTLNGKKKVTSLGPVMGFVRKCVLANDKKRVFDKKAFRRVLYRKVFFLALRHKDMPICIKTFRCYNVYYVLSKRRLIRRAKRQSMKYGDIYHCLQEEAKRSES